MSPIPGSSRRGGRGRSPLRKPNAVDQHVGERLRLRRRLLGLSQEELAARLGLALQQVQKYENGANRVSASRLYQLGQVLEVPVAWFFEEMPAEARPAAARADREGVESPRSVNPLDNTVSVSGSRSHAIGKRPRDRGALELVRSYARIEDEDLRRKLCEIAKGFAASRRG